MPSSLFRRKEIAWRFLPFSLVSFFLSITDTRGCRISSAAGTGRSRSLAASERKQPSQRLKSEELSLFFLHFCPPLFSLSFFPPTLSLPPLAPSLFLPFPPALSLPLCLSTKRGSPPRPPPSSPRPSSRSRPCRQPSTPGRTPQRTSRTARGPSRPTLERRRRRRRRRRRKAAEH